MISSTFTVAGMTCGHCVDAVTKELRRIDGVSDVEIDLVSGRVTVASSAPLDPTVVAAAVDEAGYEVAT